MTMSIICRGGMREANTELTQIAPGEYQKLEFSWNSRFPIFDETHQIRCRLMRSTPNHLIYYLSMALGAENEVKQGIEDKNEKKMKVAEPPQMTRNRSR